MRLVHALAAALLLVPPTNAWKWTADREEPTFSREESRRSSSSSNDPSNSDHLLALDDPSSSSFSSLSLSPQERQALFSTLHLFPDSSSPSSSSKPDCFRSVASKLRARCSPSSNEQDSFSVGDAQRIDAAILLTLCDLSSARITPPSECSSYLSEPKPDTLYWEDDPESATEDQTRKTGRQGCVESLSRSPQFWSSYSGYVREATQLCFALQRSNDIDRAQKMYVNATMEKIALLKHLKKNEEKLSDRLEDLTLFTAHLSTFQQNVLRSDLVASEMKLVLDGVWLGMQEELQSKLTTVLEKHQSTLLSGERASLERVLQKQEVEISSWVSETMQELREGEEWKAMLGGLSGMSDNIRSLLHQTSDLESTLSQSHSLVSRTNYISTASLTSLSTLSQTLANLSSLVETQASLVNQTNLLLERQLAYSGVSWLGWAGALVWRGLERLITGGGGGGGGRELMSFGASMEERRGFGGYSSPIERLLESWLTSRTIGFLASLIWSVVQNVFSVGLTLALFLLASSLKGVRRLVSPRLASPKKQRDAKESFLLARSPVSHSSASASSSPSRLANSNPNPNPPSTPPTSRPTANIKTSPNSPLLEFGRQLPPSSSRRTNEGTRRPFFIPPFTPINSSDPSAEKRKAPDEAGGRVKGLERGRRAKSMPL